MVICSYAIQRVSGTQNPNNSISHIWRCCDSDVASAQHRRWFIRKFPWEIHTTLSLQGTQLSLQFLRHFFNRAYETSRSLRTLEICTWSVSAQLPLDRAKIASLLRGLCWTVTWYIRRKRQLTSNSNLITERYFSLTNTNTREVQRKSLLQPSAFDRLPQNDPEQCDLRSDQPQLI